MPSQTHSPPSETHAIILVAHVYSAARPGWVWDDDFGWYYDEAHAAELLAGGTNVTTPQDNETNSDIRDSDSEDSDSNTSSGTEDGAGGGGKKRRRNRKRAAPRIFPRSKVRRCTIYVEFWGYMSAKHAWLTRCVYLVCSACYSGQFTLLKSRTLLTPSLYLQVVSLVRSGQ